MNKRTFLPRAVLAALLLTLPAAADAPTNPPQYAQFTSDSATIKDNFTLLEWDRRPAATTATWDVARVGCAGLVSLGPTGRLPTIKELLTIVDEEPHDEFEFGAVVPKMIDALAFADTPVDAPYWSSTSAGGDKYWTLDFKTGLMAALSKTQQAGFARCVR
jgi:hypothetical protein